MSVSRLLSAYNARIADEGEYDEQELPSSVVDDLEGAAGPARQAFAVRPTVAATSLAPPFSMTGNALHGVALIAILDT